MGINWQFTGDSDRTAKVSLDYRRKGTTAWRPALPLWLHDYNKRLMFSGSVFRLAPGDRVRVQAGRHRQGRVRRPDPR